MPRVNVKTKNRAGKLYNCGRCSDPIKAGERYYEWSFRYGGTRRQHEKHGRPKQSQLTQSKMSGVYAACEDAEAAIAAAGSTEDIAAALNDCASAVSDVKSEYEDGLSSLPQGLQDAGGPGGQTQEKIDALDEFASELESVASDIENETFVPVENETDEDSAAADWLEGLRSQAIDALGALSI